MTRKPLKPVDLGRLPGLPRLGQASGVLALMLLISPGCRAPAFDYGTHRLPRVSVIHRPLHPAPTQPITIIARPEAAAGRRVASVEIVYAGDGGLQRETCLEVAECTLSVPATGSSGFGLYAASVTDDADTRGRSPSAYYFEIGTKPGSTSWVLRVPFDLYEGTQAFNVLLVRDLTIGALSEFDRHLDNLINDGLLADPAYRWRDNQLAFRAFHDPGITTDRNSGNASRCGQSPWPGVLHEEEDVLSADAIGVIHRNSAITRDCSGLGGVRFGAGTRRHFSAYARLEIFKHELAHALFGLSDEYTEPAETRSVPGGQGRPCCCEDPTVGPGPGCLDPTAACGELWDPACFRADPACPPLGSDCAHPNVFRSPTECEAAAAAADSHPGVELPTSPLDCRLLCGTCPCTDGEVWTLDRRTPPTVGTESDDDIMGAYESSSAPELHGPACERCMETEFCLLWEISRGRTQAQAEAHCLTPSP